ncbi:MAG: UDP-4-amino-4,6-dideoxy-N-acetyl-beta-L-altrosamine transaminase [Candidatus Melainabacteria bacterium]|nr:UDP-4-amino-4,6-dideoxy-N-acetyl-beta-L-altrosamine transaminase [Candidatus Melainabacteria bacterium]
MQTNPRTNKSTSLALDGGPPVRKTWLPYGHQSISHADVESVTRVLNSQWLTQGPAIEQFEQKLATAVGAKYAVAYSSGTAALHGAYFACGIGKGHEIVTTALTFAATANAALYLGAIPRFADIDANTGNIDPDSASKLINAQTKAIVAVDYAGHPCDIDELKALANRHQLLFLQDAAHALGASYKDKPIGSLADMTIFSFHPVKAITTGEGGMVTTNNPELAHRLRVFRTHGIEKNAQLFELDNPGPWHYEMQHLGYNYRLTDIQAALGSSQLDRLDKFIERRRNIATQYRAALDDLDNISCLSEKEYVRSAYHLFPVLLNVDIEEQSLAQLRENVVRALHAENIGVQVHYIPVYRHPVYRHLLGDQTYQTCPSTEWFYKRVFSLPLFPAMSDQDVADVVVALTKVMNHPCKRLGLTAGS